MDATPISFDTATPLGAPATLPTTRGGDVIARQWATLHEAAAVVAALAGATDEPTFDGFSRALGQAPHGLRTLAEQGIEDLAAIMAPGLAALLTVHNRGDDARAPARALWHEFVTARAALVGLITPLT